MWKNININKQNIKHETARAILINCPHYSDYDGYSFWHPLKLVRSGRHSNDISIGYTEEFTFKLMKDGREIVIDSEEFEEIFQVMNENITAKQHSYIYETHKPEQLKAEATEALEELRDE